MKNYTMTFKEFRVVMTDTYGDEYAIPVTVEEVIDMAEVELMKGQMDERD